MKAIFATTLAVLSLVGCAGSEKPPLVPDSDSPASTATAPSAIPTPASAPASSPPSLPSSHKGGAAGDQTR